MKRIEYGALVEGYLDEYFVKAVLLSVGQELAPEIQVHRSQKFIAFKGGSKNKDKVINKIQPLSEEIFLIDLSSDFHGLLVIGVDSDKEQYGQLVEMLVDKVHSKARDLTIIFVAVREIETWAEYLLKPGVGPGSFESRSSKDRIYSAGLSAEEKAKRVMRSLRELDAFSPKSMDRLANQSPSFQDFYSKTKAYFAGLIKT